MNELICLKSNWAYCMNFFNEKWIPEPTISRFGVQQINPGYLYIIREADRYKIGSSKNPKNRIREAKTWLPYMELIGVKPFWDYERKEKLLHAGMAHCWVEGEWFKMWDEGYYNVLVPEFKAFSDHDINANSVNFIYWINGSGMSEMTLEWSSGKGSLRSFQRELTCKDRIK